MSAVKKYTDEFTDEQRSEARRALIDGAGMEFPDRELIDQAALLIEAGRDMIEDGGDREDVPWEVTDGAVVYYADIIRLATDSAELFHRVPELADSSESLSPMESLQRSLHEVLEAAVRHALAD